MRRIYLIVNEDLLDRIARVAERERRDFRQQTLVMLEKALQEAEDEQRIRVASPVILEGTQGAPGLQLA